MSVEDFENELSERSRSFCCSENATVLGRILTLEELRQFTGLIVLRLDKGELAWVSERGEENDNQPASGQPDPAYLGKDVLNYFGATKQ
jgi:hypothetical protein